MSNGPPDETEAQAAGQIIRPSIGWNKTKVDAFASAFLDFIGHVRINSKDKGGNYRIADGMYDAQNYLLSSIFDGLALDIHDFKVLKSRQLGISTITRALTIFWTGVFDGIQGAVIFDTGAHTAGARTEIESMINNLPASVKFPRIVKSNRDGIILENESTLQFMSAGVRNNRSAGVLGRSSGLNLVHGSEMCSWENDEGITSLKSSISDIFEDRLYIWESTARGPNAWKTMWDEAKRDDLGQKTIFLGWYLKPTQKIAKNTEMFEKYGAEPPSKREKERVQEVDRRYGWRVSMEQLAWYRRRMDPSADAEEDDAEDANALADQPWTEDEAFQLSGATFFSPDALSKVMLRQADQPPFSAYKFYPGTQFIDSMIEKARIKRDIELKIWEEPQSDAIYVVSGDVAFGYNEKNDRSCVQVLRCYADCVEQVAEYASASIQSHQFAWLIWTLAGYYGVKAGTTALIIIELNGPGEAVWREIMSVKQIVQQGYMKESAEDRGIQGIFRNVKQYLYSRSDAMSAGNNYHFKTSTQLKVAIMERLRDFTHTGTLLIRSLDTIEEMKGVTRDGDSIGAEGGGKDDRVMALAMGCRAWEERLRRGLVSGNRTKEADRIARSVSPVARYELFTRNQLSQFFKVKNAARIRQQQLQRRQSWRR